MFGKNNWDLKNIGSKQFQSKQLWVEKFLNIKKFEGRKILAPKKVGPKIW